LHPLIPANPAEPQSPETFSWNTGELEFTFSLPQGRLRQHIFLPSGIQTPVSLVVTMFLVPAVYLAIHGRRERTHTTAQGELA
jgi:hypothetical protein